MQDSHVSTAQCIQCSVQRPDLFVLPCLHVCCRSCLCSGQRDPFDNASTHSGIPDRSNLSSSHDLNLVFVCPRCDHKILRDSAALEKLRDINSCYRPMNVVSDNGMNKFNQGSAHSTDSGDANTSSVNGIADKDESLPPEEGQKDVLKVLKPGDERLEQVQNKNQECNTDSGCPNGTRKDHSQGAGLLKSGPMNSEINCTECKRCLPTDLSISDSSWTGLAQFCITCDVPLCRTCTVAHSTHNLCSLRYILDGRRRYVSTLCAQARARRTDHDDRLQQIRVANEHLSRSRTHLRASIEQRADELCRLVLLRRDALIKELDKEWKSCTSSYEVGAEGVRKATQNIDDALSFVDDFLPQCSKVETCLVSSYDPNLLTLHGEVTAHLNRLANHALVCAAGGGALRGVEVVSLRMDVGDRDRGDEGGVEKLFGGLMRGTVTCPGSERLATYSVDLRWPSSFVTTRSKDFVVAGKTGAFASDGKVLFFDRHGNHVSAHDFERNCLPIAMIATTNGRVLVSDTLGRISKFSSCGRLLETWATRFGEKSKDGGSLGESGRVSSSAGHMALAMDGHIWVTSSEGLILKLSALDGGLISSVRLNRESVTGRRGSGHSTSIEMVVNDRTGTESSEEPKIIVTQSSEQPIKDVGSDVSSGSLSVATENGHASVGVANRSIHEAGMDHDQLNPVASTHLFLDGLSKEPLLNDLLQHRAEGDYLLSSVNGSSKASAEENQHFDIQAIAVNSDDNLVISVLSDKSVHVFTPDGKHLFSYPASVELVADVVDDGVTVHTRLGPGGDNGLRDVEYNAMNYCDVSNDEKLENSVNQGEMENRSCTSNGNNQNVTSKEELRKNIFEMPYVSERGDTVKPSSDVKMIVNKDVKVAASQAKINGEIVVSNVGIHDKSTASTVEGSAQLADRSIFVEMKCPSALCCDPFNNILVADFTSDCVHLVSQSGKFLGRLLTKNDGIACPTFLSLDADGGRLYVGLYGGEVLVYRYLSCIKQA